MRTGILNASDGIMLLEKSHSLELPESLQDEETRDRRRQDRLVCHICNNPITDDSKRTSIGGQTSHCRTNPAGFTYMFDCFSEAPGCADIGRPTAEHTWFAGHQWQLAACKGCGEHLGWLFRGSGRFYGLIRGRVIKVPGP